jgi:hypothetical protein
MISLVDRSPYTTEKHTFIQEHELTILRNHDCWDRLPEVASWLVFRL